MHQYLYIFIYNYTYSYIHIHEYILINTYLYILGSSASMVYAEGASSLMVDEACRCFQRLCELMGSSVVYSRLLDEQTKELVSKKMSEH